MLLSQFWPSSPPTKHSFPMRNAVMSAYGRATVIAEAGETSGARIQGRVAIEHGRPVVLSQSVVDGTRWGRAMVGGPGVHVAKSAEQALDAVTAILDADDQVDRWLAHTSQ
jgi:DNA processing protein